MTTTLTEYLAQRGARSSFQTIVDLDGHRCDYANCEAGADVLVTVRVYRGLPARRTGIIELRGVCAQHAQRFTECDPTAVAIRPSLVVIA